MSQISYRGGHDILESMARTTRSIPIPPARVVPTVGTGPVSGSPLATPDPNPSRALAFFVDPQTQLEASRIYYSRPCVGPPAFPHTLFLSEYCVLLHGASEHGEAVGARRQPGAGAGAAVMGVTATNPAVAGGSSVRSSSSKAVSAGRSPGRHPWEARTCNHRRPRLRGPRLQGDTSIGLPR